MTQKLVNGVLVEETAADIAQHAADAADDVSLANQKRLKQAQLDALFNANFDLAAFIRSGTATTVTANQVGTFLATIANNYRTLKASIAAAASVSALNSISLNSGWPSNP